jgi:endonuclease/exonuclease/phosphatase family metal-dependent hydrolase
MRVLLRFTFGICVLLVYVSLLIAGSSAQSVKVMTRNMDAGTDLNLVLAYINTSTPTVGIDLTYQEILQNNFAGRAKILAQEIAAHAPDLVSLQEVTVWSTGPDPANLAPLYDQLQLILDELSPLAHYDVVKVNPLLQAALPMSNGVWLGMLDRDVVLARHGVATSNVDAKIFSHILTLSTPLGDLSAPQGWIQADVTVGSKTFRFVNTHLQSPFPGQPAVSDLQAAQAAELAAALAGQTRAVIAGDFNSNATHTPKEQTQSYGIMLSAGFTDSWTALMHGNPGFTWPTFSEDPPSPVANGPFERIDFILSRGLGFESIDRIGWKPPYASDHAGLVAVLLP